MGGRVIPTNKNQKTEIDSMEMDFTTRFKKSLHAINETRVCVSLDWLSVLFNDNNNIIPIPQDDKQEEMIPVNESTIVLQYMGGGNQYFKHRYNVLNKNEQVATILAHTRNEKFVKRGTVKIDFRNDLLYSSDLWPTYDTIAHIFRLEYKNISRMDIAVDGMNHLYEFLNVFVKQEKHNQVVLNKGSVTIVPKIEDRATMKYQNFLISGSKARKQVTIYNKSLDIVRTGKHYIQQYWKQNGLLKQLMPLEFLAKALTAEKIYLEDYQNIFRFEVRVRGERIAEIKDFSVEMLKSGNGLMSLLKMFCHRFFDFAWKDDERSSRCTEINIIPFHQFDIIPLEKAQKKKRDDMYKTRLTIHKNVKQLYQGRLLLENAAVYEMLIFDINEFELEKWFWNKVTMEWHPLYSKLTTEEKAIQVYAYLENIWDEAKILSLESKLPC